MNSTIVRRFAAVSASSAVVLCGLASSPASAEATPSGTSATAWLTGQLTNGIIHNKEFDFDDFGLSIDAGLAELTTGNTAVAAQIRDAIAAHVNDYITGESFGDPGSTYAGATAKALVYAQASGGNPTSFGGVNLVTRLESVTGPSGRIADVSSFGDNANTIGQSYAARGLSTAGSAEAAAATSFLLAQQCPAGFFRLSLGNTQCSVNTAPDTDVTALAVLNLDGQRDNPAVAAALAKATGWLLATQATDGSFGGGGVTAAPNTNSSGLAAAALGAQCKVDAAHRAASYVRSYQVPAGQTGPLGAEVGAIAYDSAARTQGQSSGITDGTSDQWRRATAQAGLGLAWDPSAPSTLVVSGPKRVVKGGDPATFTITGAATGERVCVEDTLGRSVVLTGTGGPLAYSALSGRKGPDLMIRTTTGPDWAYGKADVLGKQRFQLRHAATVRHGDRLTVRIKGLDPGEQVRLFVDGSRVDKGEAGKKGVFKGSFVASFKPGRHTLKAVGRFENRVGVSGFTVVG